jgi:predicted DCC family thiol-disulfide oxidoreductase YuxK
MSQQNPQNRPIVFFDDVCVLCSASVQWILKNEKNKTLNFAALQTDFTHSFLAAKNIDKSQLPDSILFWDGHKLYSKSSAVLRLASYLKFPHSLLSLFKIIPPFISNIFYDWIAKNRYHWFGKKDACFVPLQEDRSRFLSE